MTDDDAIDLDKVREADRLAEAAADGGARPVPDETLESVMGTKKIFTVADAAEATGYAEETIRRHCRKDNIQAAGGGEHGREYRIPRHELERWWREEMDGGSLFPDSDNRGETNENQ